MRKCVGIH